ncbi:glucose-6-phosphate isomerase [Exilibacterium tricleocarpae]|uniref:Glucose-6-phosphate isomerase n=1 Tax=Exilibacterium tricleocarpae TaxID=2591008 RepID=A0A545T294_9GAMM|nr:glucose-6-phosphate isomerase [Exilibacterium tricleocarpae]TQV71347.1 glucose-6-phosphate isomerase [Exilibacterium tricleocarpae]
MSEHALAKRYNSWSALQARKHFWDQTTLLDAFRQDPDRARHYSLTAAGLFLDYSKNHIDQETLAPLLALADEAGLGTAIGQLLQGEPVNNTEGRPALHTALRFQGQAADARQREVAATLEKMATFVTAVHSGNWRGHRDQPITDVVNIGIGGSDLGPRMVTRALGAYHTGKVTVHFTANIDGADLADTLADLHPATTLFIVASKSFSTLETRENAFSARQWTLDGGCAEGDLHKHYVAVSSNVAAAEAFGIAPDNIFPMWDWVGGRYSLWSAIGLPIALAVGMDHFNALRSGAHTMDHHFSTAPLAENMPVLLALITFWYSEFWQAQSQAVLPYAQRLGQLPAYLQQLDMESLGKSVTRDGVAVDYPTGLILWGTEGTNGQHSFHQLLHQGTRLVPVDFIASAKSMSHLHDQHTHLLACCISQSQALLAGKPLAAAREELRAQGLPAARVDELAPHKVIPGNRPSNTLVLEDLSPTSLGALIALYEHKVYCLSVLWGINAFDQWGVELGKQLGTAIHQAMASGECPDNWDASTRQLVNRLR